MTYVITSAQNAYVASSITLFYLAFSTELLKSLERAALSPFQANGPQGREVQISLCECTE